VLLMADPVHVSKVGIITISSRSGEKL